MGQPTWRPLKTIQVPAANTPWTLALAYIKAGKLIKIEADGTWTPLDATNAIGPDGDALMACAGSEYLDSAPFGCLIGRIGVSSASASSTDLTFPVGRVAVLSVPADKSGALFLGVNDHFTRMSRVAGALEVHLFEAL